MPPEAGGQGIGLLYSGPPLPPRWEIYARSLPLLRLGGSLPSSEYLAR